MIESIASSWQPWFIHGSYQIWRHPDADQSGFMLKFPPPPSKNPAIWMFQQCSFQLIYVNLMIFRCVSHHFAGNDPFWISWGSRTQRLSPSPSHRQSPSVPGLVLVQTLRQQLVHCDGLNSGSHCSTYIATGAMDMIVSTIWFLEICRNVITSGWWLSPTPLKNMKVSWDDYSQYMDK